MTRRFGAAALLMLLLGGLLVAATPGPAAAATPRCDYDYHSTSYRSGYYYRIYLPLTYSNEWRCLMSRGRYQGQGAVRQLQRTLNMCYYDRHRVIESELATDGSYGPLTQAAVTRVQRYHGILDDGIYGPETAATIWHETLVWPASKPWESQPGCHTIRQVSVP